MTAIATEINDAAKEAASNIVDLKKKVASLA